jgi:hypothetical protein
MLPMQRYSPALHIKSVYDRHVPGKQPAPYAGDQGRGFRPYAAGPPAALHGPNAVMPVPVPCLSSTHHLFKNFSR